MKMCSLVGCKGAQPLRVAFCYTVGTQPGLDVAFPGAEKGSWACSQPRALLHDVCASPESQSLPELS